VIFKILLVLVLGGMALYFAGFRRSVLKDKVYFLGLTGAIVLLALFPGLSQWMAEWLGIGRGVDLLLYCTSVVLLYALFLCYVRIKGLERKLTGIVRHMALHAPVPPEAPQNTLEK